MNEQTFIKALEQRAQQLVPAWKVEVRSEPTATAATVSLTHPASHGLLLDVSGDAAKPDPLTWMQNALAENPELMVVAAAPALAHRQLVLGVRSLIAAFEWHNREVRALAFVLWEVGALTEQEAAWLAGYCGSEASMTPVSPMTGSAPHGR
ncbi:hypothetical protein [Nitriliruptor alkaliphilus]|uniref:hypothetical protein n=1 Tax=Nitriliruptor alkaliphilus TaxID=427918 RepID=UPI0006966302|nr:hypothetical protein [Nitriliruptor alkaliphilus]